jgi:hypothetical protein
MTSVSTESSVLDLFAVAGHLRGGTGIEHLRPEIH